MKNIEGDLIINGELLNKSELKDKKIPQNALVETSDSGGVALVIGKDAYLLRENTSVKFKHNKKKKVKGIELNKGALLSVFARRRLKIRTVAAIVGVRGTGLYLEADEEKTYVCTCYGKVKLQVRNSPSISEIVKTKRHDEPRYILKNENRIVEAPIINHTDLELIMLEKLVLRKPPFVGEDGKVKGGFY